MNPDKRYQLLKSWVRKSVNSSGASIEPINSDASFRKFFRVFDGGSSYVVMDSPPDKEDNQQFLLTSGFLEKMRIPATRVIKHDLSKGFLLLNDLGPTTMLDQNLSDQIKRQEFYKQAIELLLSIQRNGISFQNQLPVYDFDLLYNEMNLFLDWYCIKELGINYKSLKKSYLEDIFKDLSNRALKQKQVFVHRDYHSRNIVVSNLGGIGIVDFQDAVLGPVTYDLVSLLRDCYFELSQNEIKYWLELVYQRLIKEEMINITFKEFETDFDLMGCQRHLKAIGIFSRLKHRDGKLNYMNDIPRTIHYLKIISNKYNFLKPLHNFINEVHSI